MKTKIQFPAPIRRDGRLFFARSEVEHHKKQIVAEAHGLPMPEYVQPDIETFVSATTIAAELEMSRRTLGRKIKDVFSDNPSMSKAG